MAQCCSPANALKRINYSPEVICLVARIFVRSARNKCDVEAWLFERDIGICRETARRWSDGKWWTQGGFLSLD